MTRIAIALLGLTTAHAVIIDRVAVRVGKNVITESEIERDLRAASLFNNQPVDLSPAARRRAADRLVDQKLIRAELELTGYPPVSDEDVDQVLAQVKNRAVAARAAGFTEEDLRTRVRWTLTAMRFLSLRFRAGLQVTDTQVDEYFEQEVAPKLRQQDPSKNYSPADHREQIEQVLIERRVSQLSEEWVKTMRERTVVEFREEAFR